MKDFNMMNGPIHFILNREEIRTEQPPGTVLLDFIRGERRLKGAKSGCREGACGACTVLMGSCVGSGVVYRSIASCLMPLGNVATKHVVTIEGLNGEGLTPVQQALVDMGASQCGFCTPGFVVSLTGFCLNAERLDYDSAVEAMAGNVCRCTGYKAVERAAAAIVASLADLEGRERPPWLVERGFLPDYFLGIPDRLRALQEKTAASNTIEKAIGRLVGGGTDLFARQPTEMSGQAPVFLADDESLKGVRLEDGSCVIGGATTLEELGSSAILNGFFPRLKQDLKRIASKQIRQVATVAGNLVNASPIADMAVFLLALNGELVLNAQGTRRRVWLKNFYKGYKKIDLSAGEMLEAVRFRIPERGCLFHFEKVAKRTHLDIAAVNSALALEMENERIAVAHFAAGGVAPTPLYLRKTSEFLANQVVSARTVREAAQTALGEIAPISDIRGSTAYRRLLVKRLVYAHFLSLFPGHPDLENLMRVN